MANALSAVATGDRAALEKLYHLTSGRLFAVIARIVRNRERAEDVLQETFVKVWHRAGRFDSEKGSPMTWLCVIARNTALNELRRTEPAREAAGAELSEIEDDSHKPADEWLCDQQDSAALSRCMDELQPDHRRSIVLAFFGGLSHSELAEKIDVPLGTMKSWIRRGLARLKGCLDG